MKKIFKITVLAITAITVIGVCILFIPKKKIDQVEDCPDEIEKESDI